MHTLSFLNVAPLRPDGFKPTWIMRSPAAVDEAKMFLIGQKACENIAELWQVAEYCPQLSCLSSSFFRSSAKFADVTSTIADLVFACAYMSSWATLAWPG